jgi:dephospho-CoA kinase
MRIGLTGGIGSGKSSVSAMLHQLGAMVIDSDAIARRMTDAGGAAIPAMRREFGDTILTPAGALDRPAMRAMAFSDPAAKHRLEAVLHPLIAAEAQREAAAAMNQVVVFDVPLLAESRDWRERVDRVLVIDCSKATQVERVSRRPGWTRESAEQVIGGQARRSVRRAIADAVIFNDGITIDSLEFEVRALWSLWRPQQ